MTNISSNGPLVGDERHEGADWRHFAACRDEDPELFFPARQSITAAAQVARAKAICARCPVVSQCLAWALDTGQTTGVWGERDARERQEIRRHLRRERMGGADL